MTQYFNDEEILSQMQARLKTFNDTPYDIPVFALMTTNHFYALEDNFDGSYTPHCKVPTTSIISMKNFVDGEDTENASKDNSALHFVQSFSTAFGIVFGGGAMHIKKRERFFHVEYQHKDKQTKYIIFNECNSNADKMIRAFNKYKSFYG